MLDFDSTACTPYTINGCNFRPGDLLGTGTISGPDPESLGCLLEYTWNGQKPLSLDGIPCKFLEEGDEVIFRGYCKGNDYSNCTQGGSFLQSLQSNVFRKQGNRLSTSCL